MSLYRVTQRYNMICSFTKTNRNQMKKLFILISIFSSSILFGNGINVSSVSFNENTNEMSFTLTWDNSWLMPNSWDAAWVFIKYAPNGGDVWHHAAIIDSTPVQNYFQFISYDDLGIMIWGESTGTFGPQEFTVTLDNLLGSYQDFKVFATEMVYSFNGSYYAGDGTSPGRFYGDGNMNTPLYITSTDALVRGNGPGDFGQEGSTAVTNISADFPKGFNSQFVMKYKISAQQYVDFLNSLTRNQQENRVQANLTGLTASNKYVMTDSPNSEGRNPIACDANIGTGLINFYLDLNPGNAPNSADDGGNLALNHLTPQDIFAYFDWAGFRPMSELEYEKFCRGIDMPAVSNEYAWGSDAFNPAGTITNSGTNFESTSNVGVLSSLYAPTPLRVGFAATSTSSRTEAGGAFIGILDIHNLGEFMLGVESTNFEKLQYGDGALDADGNVQVTSWTLGAQLLSTSTSGSPAIEPISKGKQVITATTRLVDMGARGVRKLLN